MGAVEVTAYLSYLSDKGGVSAATHGQALSALLFLYKEVLGINLPWLNDLNRPKKSARLPVVLTVHEAELIHSPVGRAFVNGSHVVRYGDALA